MKNILVLGGAGFIGSNIVKRFCRSGIVVTVIDALYENTGGSLENLSSCANNIFLIQKRVEDVENLSSIIETNDLIIDAMGWTSHCEAIKNPGYDIQLNVISHLSVIKALEGHEGKSVIYLGSRGQYGNTTLPELKEENPMLPEDVQGINKLSGESYYRVYSKFYNFNILSLRIPNCFGENQPIKQTDVGLIGNFIKDALKNNTIEIYGNHRKRSILYIADLTELIYQLQDKIKIGFSSLNINGTTLLINDLAKKIINISMSGNLVVKNIPAELMKMDMGSASLNEDQLRRLLPEIQYTEIDLSLNNTINYFKQALK